MTHYLDPKNRLKTKDDVREFTAALGTPILGTKVNCRMSDDHPTDHVAPLDVVTDVITLRALDFIAWANRSGSKTYAIGGFPTWYLHMITPLLETRILGGSEAQAKLSYSAMRDFFRITKMESEALKHPGLMKQNAEWKHGGDVSILAASTKQVRGPHPQRLMLDEVDEMDNEIYESALSQPQTKYGIPASLGMFSTNHTVNGQMDKVLTNASEQGQKVYKYCIWECLESCRDYTCSSCPLSPFCPGTHMKEADGYYLIRDFIRMLKRIPMDTLQRDWFCVKIGYGDLVYQSEWDENVHLVTVPLRDMPITLSLDWGGVDPFVAQVWQDAPEKFGEDSSVLVTDVYLTSVDGAVHNGIFIKECKTKPWWKLVRDVVVDSSRADLIREWQEELPNATFHLSDKKSIDDGIECVKAALAPVLGDPKIYVNRAIIAFRNEMASYRVKDGRIVGKRDHHPDALRYFVKWKYGKPEEGFFGTSDRSQDPK